MAYRSKGFGSAPIVVSSDPTSCPFGQVVNNGVCVADTQRTLSSILTLPYVALNKIAPSTFSLQTGFSPMPFIISAVAWGGLAWMLFRGGGSPRRYGR